MEQTNGGMQLVTPFAAHPGRSPNAGRPRLRLPGLEVVVDRIRLKSSFVCLILTLLVFAISVGCHEDPFPDRRLVQLGTGETLEILKLDMDSGHCIMWYVSDVSLSVPDTVKSRALELTTLYAGPRAVEASCSTIALNATAWRADGSWVALEITAERRGDDEWQIR